MPFQADTRCPFVSIKLNVSTVCEEIENHIEKDYTEDINEGSVFWEYVEFLEDKFSVAYSRDPNLNFWEWFPDNYDNFHIWSGIEKNFKDRDEDTSDDEEVEVLDVFYKGNRYLVDEKTNELYNEDCEIVGKAYKTDVARQWVVILSSEKDTSDEDTPEPMPEWMKKWILEQFKAIEEGELDLEKTKEFLEFVHERKDSHYIQDLFKEHMDNMKKKLNK